MQHAIASGYRSASYSVRFRPISALSAAFAQTSSGPTFSFTTCAIVRAIALSVAVEVLTPTG